MFGWVGELGGAGGEERGQHPGPARPGGDPGCPVDSWGRLARAWGEGPPPVATVASQVQSEEEEEGAGEEERNRGRGVWETALGWRSGPGAHPGSLAAEAGEGALGGVPLQPRSAVPGPGHPGRPGLGGPHGSRTGRPGKAASLSPGCGRTRAASSAAAAAAAAGAEERPALGPSCR